MMPIKLNQLRRDLRKAANQEKARILKRFFKTGPGEYGEGDLFMGIMVPDTRKIAMKNLSLSFPEIQTLLSSKFHEERLAALLLLVEQFKNSKPIKKEKIIDFYLANTSYINNWDLVDLSAHQLLGEFLLFHPKKKYVLAQLAQSKQLWEKRIAIIATYAFIKKNQFKETISIAKILIQDTHDLIQKAVGWMLREVGKRDQKVEEEFLNKYYSVMPRTALRYAIERFPEGKRMNFLKKK